MIIGGKTRRVYRRFIEVSRVLLSYLGTLILFLALGFLMGAVFGSLYSLLVG